MTLRNVAQELGEGIKMGTTHSITPRAPDLFSAQCTCVSGNQKHGDLELQIQEYDR